MCVRPDAFCSGVCLVHDPSETYTDCQLLHYSKNFFHFGLYGINQTFLGMFCEMGRLRRPSPCRAFFIVKQKKCVILIHEFGNYFIPLRRTINEKNPGSFFMRRHRFRNSYPDAGAAKADTQSKRPQTAAHWETAQNQRLRTKSKTILMPMQKKKLLT